MAYDAPIYTTFRFPASASLSTAATVGTIIGPPGKTGKLMSMFTVVTTGVTVAAAAVQVGTAGDADSVIETSVPVSAAGAALQVSQAALNAAGDFVANTAYLIKGGGEATAGAADIVLTVGWF